jgi:hypothetical protein
MIKQAKPESFFMLTPEIRDRLLTAKLTAAEWRIWCYLVSLDPFGDRGAKYQPAELMLQCGVKKSTYFAAKAKFQKLGLFDFKDGTTKVFNLQRHQTQSEHSDDSQQYCLVESKISDSYSKISDSHSEISDSHSEISDSHSKISEDRPPESLPDKASSSPQTIKTIQTKKTLSEERERDIDFYLNKIPEVDREKFLGFARLKATQLPHPPQLVEKWIATHIDWIKQEFDKVYVEEVPNPLDDDPSSAPESGSDEFFEQLHPQLKEGLISGEISRLDPMFDGLFDRSGNWWKIDDWLDRDESPTTQAAAQTAIAALRQRFSTRREI